jgi:hypothetical protein
MRLEISRNRSTSVQLIGGNVMGDPKLKGDVEWKLLSFYWPNF